MIATAGSRLIPTSVPEDQPAIRRALTILFRAYDYAAALNLDPWQLAVEIQVLRAAGVTRSDLRWLRCKDLVEHAIEITAPNDHCRTYQPSLNLSFNKRTCFVLTAAGAQWIHSVQEPLRSVRPESVQGPGGAWDSPDRNGEEVGATPFWDQDRLTLSLGDVIVKQFKTQAPNQEAILAAFQEEGWPVRIDDPIPPQLNQDPKTRLHDAVNALNRNQKNRLIRFMGDGSGQGIRWELVKSPPPRTAEANGKMVER